ncbi:MAG: DUF3810 family protein [Acidobacteria bacterium]|nr:DUF3810 family protein [Acidobacteriota bacterium]
MRLRFGLIVLAALALLVPLPSSFVERAYSSALFPHVQRWTTAASNTTAIVWLDVLVVVVLAGVLALASADVMRHGWRGAVLRSAVRLVTIAAVAYVAFLAMWGLNYQREPVRDRVPFDAARVTPDAAARLARDSVVRVNGLYREAHAAAWPAADAIDPTLVEGWRHAVGMLGGHAAFQPARPKRSLLDLYFRRAGVAGMTDPYFLETIVASDILPFERPHVVAHEWAHLAGFADEGEANFVGWLACLRGSDAHRYSGWLFLYSEVMSGLPRAEAQVIAAGLDEGPRADLRAIRDRQKRELSPRLSRAGWQVYDQYLKANRVDAGTASYAEVVQLILGTDIR